MRLSREHVRAFGQFILLSWTGTMFEYPDARALDGAAIQTPSSRARSQLVSTCSAPSAVLSESHGVFRNLEMRIGMTRATTDTELTVCPRLRSRLTQPLAQSSRPTQRFSLWESIRWLAVRNLRRMESSGWVGAYGFYEAVDYTSPGKPVLVREWMAHHQGMSLLAILNLLHNNVVQRCSMKTQWFNPLNSCCMKCP